MRVRSRAAMSALALTLLAAAPAAPADAATWGASLYSGAAPRPGPDILYAPAAVAPQLTNSGVWHAPPILVSGASAYRAGEFLYQDFLYDDHGAAAMSDPQDQRSGGNAFSKPDGTYTYPTGPAYANNAADLVEFRVKPLPQATAFRVTFNTMKDPSLVAFSLALGGADGTTYPFPGGANVRSPADLFLTVHWAGSGMVGELVQAGSGRAAGPAPAVAVDPSRRQVQVVVPHAAWSPGTSVVRMALGAGLWDKAAGRYLVPQATQDASHPGGAGGLASAAAFFNVGFRSNAQEPMPNPTDPANQTTRPAWWRDREQAEELAAGDISGLHAEVDFAKLMGGVDDETGVPSTGPMDRILASHFEPQQGADWSVSCFPQATSGGARCPGQLQGNLQPYAIYIPSQPAPATGYGMTLLLHSLSANYNQYLSSRNQSQFGDRGTGSIVITPTGRGPDGFYDSYAGADTFEVWADVARHFHLDPAWTVITGYSMGGYGTFKLAEQFPDLFAKAQPTVGANPANLNALVPSLRNVPVLMWNMATDELVPEASYYPTAMALDSAGYRYELDVFAPGDHLTLAINDQFAPAAAFLGVTRVDRNPAHVTYVVDPALDYPSLGFVADHAYWLGGLRVRNAAPATGTIDVVSHGFGVGDPAASPQQHGAGTLTGGTVPAIAYTSQFRTWAPVPAAPVADQLDIRASNGGQMAVDVARAGVDCSVRLNVMSDGPLQVTLLGCGRTLTFG